MNLALSLLALAGSSVAILLAVQEPARDAGRPLTVRLEGKRASVILGGDGLQLVSGGGASLTLDNQGVVFVSGTSHLSLAPTGTVIATSGERGRVDLGAASLDLRDDTRFASLSPDGWEGDQASLRGSGLNLRASAPSSTRGLKLDATVAPWLELTHNERWAAGLSGLVVLLPETERCGSGGILLEAGRAERCRIALPFKPR